ncbi:unnamed protein product [Medioppia subpectinata]|uniref:Nuclear receptor domain-containing protein n=1 Tax=Medioppia subpectinata TaxID=1979941 RepID=A0A7R9PU08_9ACAR|nr:unnamed protein product [Medioppia subpectinata]CAG2101240.1 unnamed protein product [Medioppia subpectinata]
MCSINILTRKFCQKCRLTKCLAIGMNEEYILNDEERHIRRMKVEAKRMALKVSGGQTIATPPTPHPSSSSDTNSETTNNTDDMFATNSNIDANKELDLDYAVDSGGQLIPIGDQQLTKIGNSNKNTDNSLVIHNNDILDAVYHRSAQFELSVIPIVRPLAANSNRLNDSECKVLGQWLSAAQLFAINISSDTETATLTDPLFGVKMFGHIFETQVRSISAVVKDLQSYQWLCETDRIALLKNSSFEIMNLRSIINYNPANDYFTLPTTYDYDTYYTYSYNGFWYWAWIFIIVPIIVCTCIGICVRRRRELARRSHPQFIITQPQYMTANGPPLYDPPPNYFMTTANGVQQQPKCVLSSLIIASIACVEPKVTPTRLGDDHKVQDYCSLTTTCEDNLTVCIDHSCYCGPNYYYSDADDECLYYDCLKSDRSVCPSFHDISRQCVSGQCVCDDETEPDVKNGGKCWPKRSGSGYGGDGISVWAWVWVVIIIPTIIGVSLVWYVRLRRRAKQKANKSTALTVSKH